MSMRLLDLQQAQHFCRPAPAVVAAVGAQSLGSFHGSLSSHVTTLSEGQINFQVHQINLLRSVDQWLLFATAHYRRAVDMLVPASAPWAQVTLYYASFFAANAILGMFGGWIGYSQKGARVVEVAQGTPGAQTLRIHRKLKSPNGVNGSHRYFWDFFYDATAPISPWADAQLAAALTPVNNDFAWQITQRNEVNYDMFDAWSAVHRFHTTFRPAKLDSLRGPLQLQFEAGERLIKLALQFATDVGLATTALEGCGQAGTVAHIRKSLSAQRAPRLVTQSAFQEF